MKLETQLFNACQAKAWNCSLTYQRINDYAVEIYTGYKTGYKLIFFTDGHIDKNKALKKALAFYDPVKCPQRKEKENNFENIFFGLQL